MDTNIIWRVIFGRRRKSGDEKFVKMLSFECIRILEKKKKGNYLRK